MLIHIQDDIVRLQHCGLLDRMLRDKTTKNNIMWATDAYAHYGHDYERNEEIHSHLITGENIDIIKTRARKEFEQQNQRTRKRAEVFTPMWICRFMIDKADEEWFGYPDVFFKGEEPVDEIRFFEKRHTWQKYVDSKRLEITCGEAPYLMSRYDVATGEIVPIAWYDIELSEGFRLILEKMLNLDPARRFQNGGELKKALENIREYDSEYRAYRRKERSRVLLFTGMLIAGLAMTGTGFFAMQREKTYAYNRALAQAEELIESEEWSSAEEALQEAVKKCPERIEAYRAELLRLYRSGNYEEALKYGKDILENPSYVLDNEADQYELGMILDILGNACYDTGDYASAAGCFRQAVEKCSDSAAFYRDYAAALAFAGDPEKAGEILKEAEALGLGGLSLTMTRGEISYVRGEFPEAGEDFREVLRKGDPDSPEERVMLRRALMFAADCAGREGGWGEAAELLKSWSTVPGVYSIAAEEKLAECCSRQAALLQETDPAAAAGLYEEALGIFLSLKSRGMVTDVLLENTATLYEQTGRMKEAEETLLEFAELFPGDYRPYKRLALLEADVQQSLPNEQRNYGRMKEYYQEAVRLFADQKEQDDAEMHVLENMIRTLEAGGWF